MYPKIWENVLLEWVNCLKLSNPIRTLQDLKDGFFFTSLIKLLTPIDSDASKNIFVRIYDFLTKQYPYFRLNHNFNSQDLEVNDLIIISSLLLHYTCIHDRRDVLTSPLCYQLSKKTQTSIKIYLERLKNDVTMDDFSVIIEASVNCKKIKYPQCQILKYTSDVDSPLGNFLNTPISKVPRLREKDHEINKLQSELDLERFEKLDIQKELAEQKERNKKLSKQIYTKTTEITKLHTEISELEGKFASNICNNEWSELQQRLRHEINSLEQYISQLHGEEEKLYDEKDKITKQVKKLQADCNFWEEKSCNLETNYEILLESHKEQEFQLDNLRRHCAELSGLLDELQSNKRSNDSCEEVDLSAVESCLETSREVPSTEELACAVVEVQLRDAQKENEELKGSMKDCQETIMKLGSEIYNNKIKIKQLQGDKEILESENEDLQSRVAVLIKTREMLDKTKSQLEQTSAKFQEVLDRNDFLTSSLTMKNKQLIEMQDTLQTLQNSNAVLTNQLSALNEDHKKLQTILSDCENKLALSESEGINVNKCFETYKMTMHETADRFQIFLFGCLKLDEENLENSFNLILNELESDRVKHGKDRQILNDNVVRLEKLIAMQKKELMKLNEREENNITEIQDLRNNLKAAEEESSVLEETVANCLDKIKGLKSTVSEMKIIQGDLTFNKNNLEENTLKLENKIEMHIKHEEVVKEIVLKLRTDINEEGFDFDNYLDILQWETKNLVEENQASTNKLETICKELDESNRLKEDLVTRLQISESQNTEVNENLQLALDNTKKLTEDSDNLKISYDSEILALKENVNVLQEKLENAVNSGSNLKQQLEENTVHIEKLNAEVQQKNVELSERNTEVESFQKHVKTLKIQNNALSAKSKDVNRECLKFNKKCKELENNIRSVVNDLSAKNEELESIILANTSYKQKAETKIIALETDFSKCSEELQASVNLNKTYENKISNLDEMIVLLGDKEKEHIDELNKVKEQLNANVLKYTEALQAHQELQNDSESQINGLTENIHELIRKYNALDNTHQETNSRLDGMQSELLVCRRNEAELEERIRSNQLKFKEEFDENSTNLNLKIRNLKQEKEEIGKNLKKITDKLHSSEKVNKDIHTNFQNICVVLAYEKLQVDKLRKSLSYMYDEYKAIKSVFENIKLDSKVLLDNSHCLNEFKTQFSNYLKVVGDENNNIRNYNCGLQSKLAVLQTECDTLRMNLENAHKKDEKIALLTKENQFQKEVVNALEKDKEKLHVELSTEQETMNNLREEIDNYILKLDEFQRINNDLKTDYEEHINRISYLESLMNEKIEEISALTKENQSQKEVVNDLAKIKEQLHVELSSEQKNLNNLIEEIDDYKQKLEEAQNVNIALKTDHEVCTNRISYLESLISEKELQISNFAQENHSQKEAVNSLIKEKEQLNIELSSEQKKLNNLREEIANSKLQLDEFQKLNNELKTDYEERIKYISNLECLMNEKEEEISTLTKENQSQKETINDLVENKDQLNVELSSEQKKQSDLIEEIENYKLQLDKVQKINSDLTTGCEEHINRISNLESSMKEKDDEIQTLLNKVETDSRALKEICTKNNNLELELSSSIKSYRALVDKCNNFEETLHKERKDFIERDKSVKEALLSAQKEIDNLKEKVKIVFVERQALELELKVANEKINEYESFVRKKEIDIGDANSKLVTKLEEMLLLEKSKQTLQDHIEELKDKMSEADKEKNEVKESYEKLLQSAVVTQEDFDKQQNTLLKRIEDLEDNFGKAHGLLQNEKMAKEDLENKLLDLRGERSKFVELLITLKNNFQKLTHTLSETPFEIESNETNEVSCEEFDNIKAAMEMLQQKVLGLKDQNKSKIDQIAVFEQEKLEISRKLEEVDEEKLNLEKENQQLLQDVCNYQAEKNKTEIELRDYKDLQIAHEVSKAKYEQLKEYQINIEGNIAQTTKLEEELQRLNKKFVTIHTVCEKFAGHSATCKVAIDKLIIERNFVENIVNNLKQSLKSLSSKILNVKDERERTKLRDQFESFEFIVDDLQKQFLQITRKVHSIILKVIEIPSKTYNAVVAEKFEDTDGVLESFNFEEELEKISDCRNSANNLLDQISQVETGLGLKLTRTDGDVASKATINVVHEVKVKDEDLRKKNTILKQRLTLSENAKANLEKKIKQLRQENKLLQEKSSNVPEKFDNNMETSYKTLLQQHIELRDKLNRTEEQHAKVLQEYEKFKLKHKFVPEQIKYEKSVKSEQENKFEKEVVKLREAYSTVMSDNSRLDLENVTLRKLLDDRTVQLSELSLIKEAYEKLLEENNTFHMELDTIKYKKNKDREALLEAVKKTQDLKVEYEVKLEKMKEKTVHLYREELNKENQRHHSEKALLLKKIAQQQFLLDHHRFHASTKSKEFESGEAESYSSGDSFFIPSDASNLQSTKRSLKAVDDLITSRSRRADDRKCATLPKTAGMHSIQENSELTINKLKTVHPSLGQKLEMEDEDDEVFNNKYLADLKEGRCVLPTNRESNVNRLSELKWRNSLYPPHLKSSYPAETQFSSPSQFKEEDIKTGVIELDDSLSTKLLPGEKPRKKDIGTTSYKKPGPPTPSKNGGRMSLQGNEREALREHNDAPKTPKRNTPSRLKYLFMGRNLSTKENSENQSGTPRSKRLSIFRKK